MPRLYDNDRQNLQAGVRGSTSKGVSNETVLAHVAGNGRRSGNG